MDISLINILKFKQKRAFFMVDCPDSLSCGHSCFNILAACQTCRYEESFEGRAMDSISFCGIGYNSSKVVDRLFFLAFALGPSGSGPIVTKVGVEPPLYCTTDDFYKLTGVRFPELVLADSISYERNDGIPTILFNEYMFVPKSGSFDFKFIKRLDKACERDPDHWSVKYGSSLDNYGYLSYSILKRAVDEELYYRYFIYPDKEPVDRSRGQCDRMVKRSDGTYSRDWQGNFVYVEVYSDVVILRRGWL